MKKIKSQMPPKRLRDIDPAAAKVFKDLENLRVGREVVIRLAELVKERNVDLKKFLKKNIKVSELSELAKLVPELQTKQKPGLRPTVDVLLEVTRKANEKGISRGEASKLLFGYPQRFYRARKANRTRSADLAAMYNLKP